MLKSCMNAFLVKTLCSKINAKLIISNKELRRKLNYAKFLANSKCNAEVFFRLLSRLFTFFVDACMHSLDLKLRHTRSKYYANGLRVADSLNILHIMCLLLLRYRRSAVALF